jgi:sulfur-oxidizing protein SoxY
MQRRAVLKGGLSTVPLAMLAAAGLLPRLSAASASSNWPSDAFNAEDLEQAERSLFSDVAVEDSDLIVITAPDIAENGRVVPVEIAVGLPNPQRVALLSDGNPFPLLAQAHFTLDVEPVVSVRVKMGESANLIALAEADGKLYRAMRAVKVTAGGCGG